MTAEPATKKRGRPAKTEVVATDEQLANAACCDPLAEAGLSDALHRINLMTYGEPGGWLHQVFDVLNNRCFGDRLPSTPMHFALTPHGKCLGLTHTVRDSQASVITINPATLNPDAWELGDVAGWRHAATTLLHEMLHVAQHRLFADLPNPGETSHNQDIWCREANRISLLIDLPPICTRFVMRRNGKQTRRMPLQPCEFPKLTQLAVGTWPHGIASAAGVSIPEWQDRVCRKLGVPEPTGKLKRCRV